MSLNLKMVYGRFSKYLRAEAEEWIVLYIMEYTQTI